MTTFTRPREALLLVIVLLALVGSAAGCAQASNVRAKLAVSGASGTSSPGSASLAPASPTATITPTVQPTVSATTSAPPPPATATPTGPAPTPTPTVSGSPAPASGSASLLWLWVLIGVIAVVGLITLVSQAGRHRAARIRDWRAMAVDTFAKGAALHDAVSVAGLPGDYGGNAGARWADIQRRADDLTQTLYRLREAAPGADERARVDDVLASLYALRSATQAGPPSGGPGPGPGAGNLQARLRNFEAALRALREPE